MTEKKKYNLNKFYSKIYRRYDLINMLFTLGLDKMWRRYTIEKCLEETPETVLDLCCGTGDLAISLAKSAKANISITGYDMNTSMLKQANHKTERAKLSKIEFVQGDAAQMPFETNSFDRITIGFGFRNLTFENPNKDKHISEMYRVLKPGGSLLILESGVPENRIIRLFYKIYLYLILVPLGGIISGDFKAYWYLAHSSLKFFSLSEIDTMLIEQGFSKSTNKSFLFGSANLIVCEK